MKTKSYLVYALCAILQPFNFANAQIVWLTTRNMDFSNADREERKVEKFTSINNSVPFDIIYEQSAVQKVVVEGDREYFDRLHTDVVKGVLEINMDRGRYRNVRLRIRISSPEIESIRIAGSGDLLCTSDIKAKGDFTLRVAGSGDIEMQSIYCKAFSSSVAGSGDIRVNDIKGTDVEIKVSGSGDFKASDVVGENLSTSIAGSGDIKIGLATIEDGLSASVAGSGDISINGSARDVKARVVGSGDIHGKLSYENISKVKSGSGGIEW